MREHVKRPRSPKYDMIYKFIIEFKRTHDGNSPAIRTIGKACRVSSTGAVRYYLNGLIRCRLIVLINKPYAPLMIIVVGGAWNAPAVKPN